jgi:hypothetical protein
MAFVNASTRPYSTSSIVLRSAKKVYRSIDELQADLDGWIKEYKRGTATSGALVLRQDLDADLLGCNADGEGENDRGLTATDTKT